MQWGRVDVEQLSNVKMSSADLRRYRLVVGDILVCEGGEVGRAAIWTSPIDECYYQKALHRLRPKSNFSKVIATALFQRYSENGFFKNFVTQTNIAHLPKEKFVEVPLPIPTPDEQKAIAGALSDVDGLIAGLEALIAKKRSLKTATMQQLLTGKTRLPGFGEGVGMKQTELGEIPEDWDVESLGPLAEMKSGAGNTSALISDDDEFPCFGGNGLRGFTSTKTHSGEFPLIGRQGAHCGNIQFATGDFFASEHAIVLTAKPDVFPLWLNYILTTRNLNRLSESSD